MKEALFFADAGSEIGLGHVMRSLSLADSLAASGWRCTLVAPGNLERMLPDLQSRGHGFVGLASGTTLLGPTVELRNRFPKIGIVVVDSYDASAVWEAQQRDWADRIVVIDDLANRHHDCDVLVDQTPDRPPSDYRNFVPDDCTILTGGSFAMLRGSFLQQRRASDTRRTNLCRIVVNFGGSDPLGMTGKTLHSLLETGLDLEIDVVLGTNSDDFAVISAMAASTDRASVRVHQFVENIAELFAVADLAIGAGGSSLLEKCCLGLPSLIVTTASNQHFLSKSIADRGAGELLGSHQDVNAEQMKAAITKLATCGNALAAMSEAAANICDGKGGLRVASALLPSTVTRDGKNISLRRVHCGDAQIVYDWQTEPNSRRFFRQPEVPSREEHDLWFKRRLVDTDNITLIVLVAGKAAGMVRLDCAGRLDDRDALEVSIIIGGAHRELGVGGAALRLIQTLAALCPLVAEVNPDNVASMRAFEQAGFERVGQDRLRSPGLSPVMPQ